MPLESANNFEQLDETWPLLGDTMKQTGAHIRQLKRVLKLIFPGVSGNGFNTPILSTEAEWNRCTGLTAPVQAQLNTIKSNSILVLGFMPYSGLLSNIPANYQLCNGTNGTPDLTDRFIMSTTIQGEIGSTGGSADKIVPAHLHTMNHFHSVTLTTDGDHTHNVDTVQFDSTSDPTATLAGSSPLAIEDTQTTSDAGTHSHTVTVDSEVFNTTTDGAAAANTNNPAWIKLAFIMRIS